MNKKDIKLIGLDLDGTLLHDDKSISRETIEYLESLAEQGIEIVPITGRPIKGITKELRSIKGINYIITSNGAQIIDNKADKSIFSFSMDNELTNYIIDIVSSFGCRFEAFANGVGYCDYEGYKYYQNTYKGTPVWEYIRVSRFCVDSIKEQFKDPKSQADEIFIICESSVQRDSIKEKMAKHQGIQFCYLGDRFLEITKLGTDKGNALQIVCDHLGISTKNTIAFGDGDNDLEFMEKAGYSVAMANACDNVKKRADIIADTNNNDGVIKVLHNILEKD